jgi:hypothetical protein
LKSGREKIPPLQIIHYKNLKEKIEHWDLIPRAEIGAGKDPAPPDYPL